MYPNQNVNLSQIYPGQSYSARTGYAYPFYIQPNHPINIATPSPTLSQKTTSATYNDIFTNAASIPSLPTSQARFQEFYQTPSVPEPEVVRLPKYFRCTLGEGPSRYRRERTVFTQAQLRVFEKRFESQKYLTTQERYELARNLGLSALQVKTWFQNRRMKWKKAKMSTENPKPSPRLKEKDKQSSLELEDSQTLLLTNIGQITFE